MMQAVTLCTLWILAASLHQIHSAKWQQHTVKFLSFQAPADSQIHTFPDPLPDKKEKPLFTHFLVNLWLDPDKPSDSENE